VEFRLSDDGPGFSSDFASGFPAGFATTKPEGMGLGLTLSRSITEWHGGHLMLGNQAHGARLTMSLPVAPET
jgi:two-component system sensor kinase FixL